MCVDSGKWNVEKEKIADRIGEMTNIWYVGVKQRNIARVPPRPNKFKKPNRRTATK